MGSGAPRPGISVLLTAGSSLRIQLLFLNECPHSDAARALIKRCVTQVGLEVPVEEQEGDFPSPTILVNGVDVMGGTATHGLACRLDVPTEERLVDALLRAIRQVG